MKKTKIIFILFLFAALLAPDFHFAEAKAKKLSVSGDVPLIHPRSAWSNAKDDKRSKKVWPAQLEDPEVIIVHHTATTSQKSTAKQIRDINKYHSYTRRWGDIGYNYIIGKDGAIFEGRYGGNGVIGGHAYNDKKKINFNKGSIGIAILGNYEKSEPSPAALDSLEKLVGWLATNNGISIAGEREFLGKELDSGVVGHKDVDDTGCPGKKFYAGLSSVRTAGASRAEIFATYAYKAEKKDGIFEIAGGKRYFGSQKQPVITLAAAQADGYPAASSEAVVSAPSSETNKKKSKWQAMLERNGIPEIHWQRFLPKISRDEYKKAVRNFQTAQNESAESQLRKN